MLAAQGGHLEAVRALLESGVQANDKRGNATALTLAEKAGHSEVSQVIKDAGEDADEVDGGFDPSRWVIPHRRRELTHLKF